MSYLKILDVNVNILRNAAKEDFMNELRHEIERKLASLDDMEGFPYNKSDIIQCIKAIETGKVKFVRGESPQNSSTRTWITLSACSR